jgi:hypothetical protein
VIRPSPFQSIGDPGGLVPSIRVIKAPFAMGVPSQCFVAA